MGLRPRACQRLMLSISELSVVGGWTTGQTHFMVGPGRGPTIKAEYLLWGSCKQPKKQLKVQIIGILEKIDSFYWPKMHLWKGDKKLGRAPPPHLDKIQKNSNFFSWNLPYGTLALTTSLLKRILKHLCLSWDAMHRVSALNAFALLVFHCFQSSVDPIFS